MRKFTAEERAEHRERALKKFQEMETGFLGSASASLQKAYSHIPATYRKNWLKAHLKISSAKKAIEAFCQRCVGYEEITKGVGQCTATSCPLHKYRPYQGFDGKATTDGSADSEGDT